MNISTKIWLSIGILIFGYLVSMVFGHHLSNRTETGLQDASEYLFPMANLSQFALSSFNEQVKQYHDAILTGEEVLIKSADQSGRRALEALLNIQKISEGRRFDQKARLDLTIKDLKEYADNAQSIFGVIVQTQTLENEIEMGRRADLDERVFHLGLKAKEIRENLADFVELFSKDLKAELTKIGRDTRRQQYLNMVLFLVVVIVSLSLIAIIVSQSITRPLKKTFMLKNAVEQSVDGIAVTDYDGHFQFINESWASMHGYEQEELIGRHVSCLHTSEQYINEVVPFHAIVKQRGSFKGEVGHKRKDGKEFPAMTAINLLYDDQENQLSLVTIARDITEQKQNEIELRKAKENAENANQALEQSLEILKQAQNHLVQSEKMAALGGLVAGIAHEINTPIGVGVTAASFLEEKTRTCSERYFTEELKRSDFEKYLQTASETSMIILKNLNRAADLINSFKQVAVDQSEEKRRRFNVKTYIEEVLVSLKPRFKQTSHRVIFNCPEDIEIYSYPGAFSQIVTNLIINSLVHGFENIHAGEIVCDISTTAETIQMRYKDNGRGMSEKDEKKIFDPFFTTKRGHGGTGLGMHIVYNLVTQTLNGSITCRARLGEGVEFNITIPVDRKTNKPEATA